MAWFIKPQYSVKKSSTVKVNEGLWHKCQECNNIIYNKDWEENMRVCTHCGHHERLNSFERIQTLVDTGTFIETNTDLISVDSLGFHDGSQRYMDKIMSAMEKTNLKEAVVTGYGKIGGVIVELAVMDFSFMGGSMGAVVGEKITLAVEEAEKHKRPLVIVSASGGARMQEGIFSLMQMAKTSAALKRFSNNGGLYIALLTDPTSGGVTASYAMLGDFTIAEKKAFIGFTGPRIIEQTIKQKLPPGFQRSEFLYDHGFVDIVAERKQIKGIISKIIYYTSN